MSENCQLQTEVKETKNELEARRRLHKAREEAPSIASKPGSTTRRNVTPPSDGRKKLYAEALSRQNGLRHRPIVKSEDNQTAETVKDIIKSRIDPVDMKIGIRSFKDLKDDKLLIEIDTKDDIEIINSRQMW